MKSTLFDRSILSTFEEALAFVGSILEASTEYSIIAKDLVGTIVLEPGFAASVRQSNVYTHLTRASTPPSASPMIGHGQPLGLFHLNCTQEGFGPEEDCAKAK